MKGNVPWIKGKKGVTSANSGSFKKGYKPKNKGIKGWTNSGSFKKGHSLDENSLKKLSESLKKRWKKFGHPSKGRKLTSDHKRKLRQAKLKNPVRYWKGKHTPNHGEKCHLWRGGITPVNQKIRSSLEYKLWRRAVFERDGYTCVWCGNNKSGNLEADHIKPFAYFPELRFAIDNGRTLCKECHRKTFTYKFRK